VEHRTRVELWNARPYSAGCMMIPFNLCNSLRLTELRPNSTPCFSFTMSSACHYLCPCYHFCACLDFLLSLLSLLSLLCLPSLLALAILSMLHLPTLSLIHFYAYCLHLASVTSFPTCLFLSSSGTPFPADCAHRTFVLASSFFGVRPYPWHGRG
jgi:hypothetical protein